MEASGLLITNGRIVDTVRRTVEPAAVAVVHGRILDVGDAARLRSMMPVGARTVDVGGRVLTPGFVDGHVHLLGLGLRLLGDRLDLTRTRSLAEVLELIDRHTGTLPPGEWVRGGGWDSNTWPERRRPRASDLDGHADGRPVALTSRCGHSMWVSHSVLRLLGITAETPDPPGGVIGRRPDGSPDGMLYENAIELVHGSRPEMSVGRRKEALLAAIALGQSLGLVGCHNCEGPETLGPLLELQREDRLRFRVTQHIPEEQLDLARGIALGSGLGGQWLRIGSLKVYADGSLGARTAAMLEPFAGETHTGVLERHADAIEGLARRAAEAGLPLAVHAIGDRAVREVLDGIERAGVTVTSTPHRIEHAQHVHPDDLHRMARLGVVASVQPVHLREDASIVQSRLPDRADQAFTFASMTERGIRLCMGSDAPVESFDPLEGLRAAVLRRDRMGRWPDGWHPHEAIGVFEAIDGYTRGAAVAAGVRTGEGRIAPGCRADLVALSHDIVADPEALEACRVDLTVIGGTPMHDPLGLAV